MEKYQLYKERIKEAAENEKVVRIFFQNGFQMSGVPTGRYDEESFELGTDIIRFEAITTMTRSYYQTPRLK